MEKSNQAQRLNQARKAVAGSVLCWIAVALMSSAAARVVITEYRSGWEHILRTMIVITSMLIVSLYLGAFAIGLVRCSRRLRTTQEDPVYQRPPPLHPGTWRVIIFVAASLICMVAQITLMLGGAPLMVHTPLFLAVIGFAVAARRAIIRRFGVDPLDGRAMREAAYAHDKANANATPSQSVNINKNQG